MAVSPFRRDDKGVGTGVLAFSIAGLIFMASMAAILTVSRTSTTTPAVSDPQTSAALTGKARGLVNILLDSPGYGAGGTDWAPANDYGAGSSSADSVTRLGLMDAANPGVLSFAKMQNLRRAPYEANPSDGFVNYPEARTDLGLANENLNFHIRAYPTLPTVAQLLKTGTRDHNLRITYLGDIDVSQHVEHQASGSPTDGMTATAPTCAVSPLMASPNPQDYRLSTVVTNGGTTTTQFSVLFTYKLGTAQRASQNSNSPVLAPGASVTVSIDVPALSGTSCTVGSTIRVDVHDPVSLSISASTTIATAVGGAVVAPKDLWLDSSKTYYINANGATTGCSDPVTLNYDGSNLAKNDKMAARVVRSDGTQVYPSSGTWSTFAAPAPDQKKLVAAGCLAEGSYTATLVYYSGSSPTDADERVTEEVIVTTGTLAAYSAPGQDVPTGPDIYTPTEAAIVETGYLNTLVDKFCPFYFDSAADSPMAAPGTWSSRCSSFKGGMSQPGDVFPDSKKIMDNDLPARLLNADGTPRYDIVNVLVAGSNIDQTAMTSQAAKGAVGDWVLGGGLLIVFGSTNQNVNWLEPIFHSAIRSSSGGIGVPDPGHPVLHTADQLDYPQYDNRDRVWNFNGQTAQDAAILFTNIVVQGSDPVTTESNPGAMGDGAVILTTWTPYDVYDGSKDAGTTSLEGLKLVNNLLMQGYKDLFLDYGPPLPSATNVVPAMRIVEVQHPQFADPLELSVILFVFQ
ncbi:MAG: hypothetical protein V4510_03785 [bacterium]